MPRKVKEVLTVVNAEEDGDAPTEPEVNDVESEDVRSAVAEPGSFMPR